MKEGTINLVSHILDISCFEQGYWCSIHCFTCFFRAGWCWPVARAAPSL